MEGWKDRLKEELVQTKERLERLHKRNIMNQVSREFDMDKTPSRDAVDIDLMDRQERALREYLRCLELRAWLNGIALD